MRINRFLALAGFGSRRAVETLVLAGRVTVNGEVTLDLSTHVEDDDAVRVDNRPARLQRFRYFAFNKPPGLLCTRTDEKGRDTIYSVLPKELATYDYVGRLDKESEGLLILTNDGNLAQRLTNPRYKVEKEYEVALGSEFHREHLARLMKGTVLEGVRARATRVWIKRRNVIGIVLQQGLKRQIREMLARLGYEVKALRRVRVGSIELGRMPRGAVRELNAKERDSLLGGGRQSAA